MVVLLLRMRTHTQIPKKELSEHVGLRTNNFERSSFQQDTGITEAKGAGWVCAYPSVFYLPIFTLSSASPSSWS